MKVHKRKQTKAKKLLQVTVMLTPAQWQTLGEIAWGLHRSKSQQLRCLIDEFIEKQDQPA